MWLRQEVFAYFSFCSWTCPQLLESLTTVKNQVRIRSTSIFVFYNNVFDKPSPHPLNKSTQRHTAKLSLHPRVRKLHWPVKTPVVRCSTSAAVVEKYLSKEVSCTKSVSKRQVRQFTLHHVIEPSSVTRALREKKIVIVVPPGWLWTQLFPGSHLLIPPIP